MAAMGASHCASFPALPQGLSRPGGTRLSTPRQDGHRYPVWPVCFGSQKFHLGTVFAGRSIRIKQVADKIRLVSFLEYDWDSSLMRRAGSGLPRTPLAL